MDVRILLVDDSITDLMMLQGMLKDYKLFFAHDGIEAMEEIEKNPDLDMMILDLNMPRMDGFEVLKALRKDERHKNITTLILTNYDETENEIRGLNLGAVDYIRKPLNMQSLEKRIEIHSSLRNARKSMEEYSQHLEEKVLKRTRELEMTRDITIFALVGLLEVRNVESSNHTKRTQGMMKAFCEHLKTREEYAAVLNSVYVYELIKTAPLHDIGKVGIPDKILLKPGKLDYEEFEIMKRHTTYGIEALGRCLDIEKTGTFIHTAIEIVGTHHEKFDGTGYPRGMKGTEIPLGGRMMAIIDVYDALTSERIYKPAFTHEEALETLLTERGKHFDPDLVNAFMEIEKTVRGIAAGIPESLCEPLCVGR